MRHIGIIFWKCQLWSILSNTIAIELKILCEIGIYELHSNRNELPAKHVEHSELNDICDLKFDIFEVSD